jgi:hypothetical protein
MYTKSIKSMQYAPGEPPSNPEALVGYIRSELSKVQAALTMVSLGHLDPCHVEPEKPREGDYRLADGTDWDPGSGRGVYIYDDTSWVLWVAMP